jgi:hypothetical protein
VIETHLREVEHEALARCVRQDELRRQDDLGALARQPGIDAGIRAHELGVADVEAPRDVREGVFVPGDRHLQPPHDVLVGRDEEAVRGLGERQRRRRRRGLRCGLVDALRLLPQRLKRRAGGDERRQQRNHEP